MCRIGISTTFYLFLAGASQDEIKKLIGKTIRGAKKQVTLQAHDQDFLALALQILVFRERAVEIAAMNAARELLLDDIHPAVFQYEERHRQHQAEAEAVQ